MSCKPFAMIIKYEASRKNTHANKIIIARAQKNNSDKGAPVAKERDLGKPWPWPDSMSVVVVVVVVVVVAVVVAWSLNSSAFRVLASPAVHMHSKNRPTFTLLHCTQPHSQLQFLNVYKGMSGKTARDRSVKKSALKKSRQYKISVAVQQSFKICDNISPLSLSSVFRQKMKY